MASPEPLALETPHGVVSGLIEGSASAETLVVLAPGAGAGMTHEFMDVVARGLAGRGFRVCRFNFAYFEAGRRGPDRQPVLESTYRAVVDDLADERRDRNVVLGGKSMGGRIASHVVAAGLDADGLLFLGYPLHPPGKPEKLRDRHLYDISTPMLFVEGTRDPFCPLATLEAVRSRLVARSDVVVVEDGDHSFRVRKSSGRPTSEAWTDLVDRAGDWMARLGGHVER